MRIEISILRRRSAEDAPYRQTIVYETESEHETVATALLAINRAGNYRDTEGAEVGEIRFENSCLQKKCGACAMRIDGRPRLACDAFLREFAGKGRVLLEPLRKFPVVADLLVDRSIMRQNLLTMQLWMRGTGKAGAGAAGSSAADAAGSSAADAAGSSGAGAARKKSARRAAANREDAYDASRCLQCGCCLEICPNFCPGDTFSGAAAFVPTTRLLVSLPAEEQKALRALYRERVYAGCGKSLSCRDVCPAGIDTERLLARSNAIAVWKRG